MESTKRKNAPNQSKKAFMVSVGIVAVCLLFMVCTAVGVALSGMDRVAKRGGAAQSTSQTLASSGQGTPQTSLQAQETPSDLVIPFLALSICVGSILSYLILRSSGHGWTLAGAVFLGMYGISTVVSQIESIVFLSSKFPHGMLGAIFVQGAISSALFAPLAVWMLGKWRAAMPAEMPPAPERIGVGSAAWRLALLIIAFVFLYMFFGYYVAWQNPEVRKYYGGPEWTSFFAALKGNWINSYWIYPLAVIRALLYVAFVFPLIRMLRVARWESATATALFLSAWTTMLWLPNSLMPASVARSHFWETLGFSLVFGTLLGALLNTPSSAIAKSDGEARLMQTPPQIT